MVTDNINDSANNHQSLSSPINEVRTTSSSLNVIIQAGFYVFLFSLPFEGILTSSGFLGSSSQGIWSLSRITGLFLILTFITQPHPARPRLAPGVWGFLIYAILSTFIAIVLTIVSNATFLSQILTIPWLIIIFMVCCEIFQDPVTRNRGVKILSIAIGICAFLQLTENAFSRTRAMVFGSTEMRIAAFDSDPNFIAAQYIVGLLLAVFFIINIIPSGKIMKIVALAVAVCCLFTLMQSGSRGAVISGAVACLAFLISRKPVKERIVIWVIGFLVVGLITLLILYNPGFRQRFNSTITNGDTSERTQVYQLSYNLFLASPWIGYGPGRNTSVLGKTFGQSEKDTHNVLLWVLTANGMIGFIPFIFGLGAVLLHALRARYGPDDIAPLALCSLAIAFSQTAGWEEEKLFWVLLAFAASAAVFTKVRFNPKKPVQPFS